METSNERHTPSSCTEQACTPSVLFLLEYHQIIAESLVDNKRISCYPSSIRFLSYCCLAESAESSDCQKIIQLQWYNPSCSRSSWSWWRIIFAIASDVFLKNESVRGLLRGFAQVSLLPTEAKVSLMQMDTLSFPIFVTSEKLWASR